MNHSIRQRKLLSLPVKYTLLTKQIYDIFVELKFTIENTARVNFRINV